MVPLPSLRQLRYLVALADTLHFGKAADACAVTQSTLSSGIRELETLLGVPVAERTKRSVLITPLGQQVVDRARHLLRDAEAIIELGTHATRPMSRLIELGVIPTIGPFLLPRLLPQINARFPELKLALREDRTEALLERLADGRLDLVLMALPYATEGCEVFPLFSDPYVFACDAANGHSASDSIGVDEIEREPLLLLERDHCLHSHALPLLESMAGRAQNSFSATSLHTLVAMVAEGMGTTLLPQLAVRAGILQSSSVTAIPVEGEAGARMVSFVWRKQSSRADEFRKLGALVREWAALQFGDPPTPPPCDKDTS